MNQSPESDEARRRIQKSRNWVLASVLAAFVILVYAISVVRMD